MTDFVLSDQNFKEEVLKAEMPVLVDFWAPWCGPCRLVSPIIDELTKEYQGKIKVGKLNVDENPQTTDKFGIMSIPTILLFKKGQVAKTLIGVQNGENYRKEINQVLKE